MSIPRRFLQSPAAAALAYRPGDGDAPPPEAVSVDSDIVVILAALLCALICVVGLALVARCAWIRRSLGGASSSRPPPNKGLKKKVISALPKLSFDQQALSAAAGKVSAECPICLAEFADGDEIRILPQCGHGFHVSCVDIWLGSHSSCPSCRQILVAVPAPAAAPAAGGRCRRCGASSGELGAGPGGAVADEAGVECDANRFLP